jgi:hypothetical protein
LGGPRQRGPCALNLPASMMRLHTEHMTRPQPPPSTSLRKQSMTQSTLWGCGLGISVLEAHAAGGAHWCRKASTAQEANERRRDVQCHLYHLGSRCPRFCVDAKVLQHSCAVRVIRQVALQQAPRASPVAHGVPARIMMASFCMIVAMHGPRTCSMQLIYMYTHVHDTPSHLSTGWASCSKNTVAR